MRLHRVVVGVDFSKASIMTAKWAARELPRETEIVLAHVAMLPPPPPILRARYPKHALTADTLRVGADRKLQALSRTMTNRRVWPEQLEGPPAHALVEIARAYDASLIIVGPQGAGTANAGLGSTARELLGQSHVPVLVLHPDAAAAPFHFLVPVEREDSASWALEFVRTVATEHDTVTLLNVIPAGVLSHALAATGGDDPSDSGNQPDDRWTALADRIGLPVRALRSEQAFGLAGQEIHTAAVRLRADFVVLPRRNAGSVRRALLGSVTAGIVARPPTSVVVVPERID